MTTYNRRERLRAMLEPLLADSEALELVVVVDACHDGSFELLETMARSESRLRPLMTERNLGQPRARLLGVQAARGDVVLSLDDDVVAETGLVGGHRRHHARHPHALVLGYMPTEIPARRSVGQFATYEYARAYEDHCAIYERDPQYVLSHLWGGNFSVRRSDFLAGVEGCEFPLSYHEDRDLGLRFSRLGLEPVFDRNLRASHRHERSFDTYLRDARSAGAGARLLVTLHPDLVRPFDPDEAIPKYSPPARVVVRCSDVAWLRSVSLSALRLAANVSGRIGAFALEGKFAAVAKHVAERQGAREGLGSPPSMPGYYRGCAEYREMLDAQDPRLFDPYVELFASHVKQGDPVVDIGCGVGESTRQLRAAGFAAVGADVSERFLPPGADGFLVADFEAATDVANGAYAAAGALNVLEHAERPQRLLSEMVRIVWPGGHVILLSPNLTSPLVALRVLRDQARGTPPYLGISGRWEAICLLALNLGRSVRAAVGADAFGRRRPTVDRGIVGYDTDAVYWSNAAEVRRFLERQGCRIVLYQGAGRTPVARVIARWLPSFAGQLRIVALTSDRVRG